MKVLALIPARGKSTRVPNKNMQILWRETLVDWAVYAAQLGGDAYETRCVVSTDDRDIAAEGESLGCDVVMRSESPPSGRDLEWIMRHALLSLWLRDRYSPDVILVLQPTSPLRGVWSVESALAMMKDPTVDSVVAVKHCPEVAFVGRLNGDEWRHAPSPRGRQRTQDINAYADCGALYAVRAEWFRKNKARYGGKCKAIVLDRIQSIDIDTQADLETARAIVAARL